MNTLLIATLSKFCPGSAQLGDGVSLGCQGFYFLKSSLSSPTYFGVLCLKSLFWVWWWWLLLHFQSVLRNSSTGSSMRQVKKKNCGETCQEWHCVIRHHGVGAWSGSFISKSSLRSEAPSSQRQHPSVDYMTTEIQEARNEPRNWLLNLASSFLAWVSPCPEGMFPWGRQVEKKGWPQLTHYSQNHLFC